MKKPAPRSLWRLPEDRNVHFVAAVADSYEDLVRAWFKQVDGSPGDWYRSDRLMTTRSCGSVSIMPCDRRRSEREDCRLVPNRIEKPYGGFPMSGSSSWRRTRRADPMSVSGTPS